MENMSFVIQKYNRKLTGIADELGERFEEVFVSVILGDRTTGNGQDQRGV